MVSKKRILSGILSVMLVLSAVLTIQVASGTAFVYADESGYINDSGVRFRSSASTASSSNIILTFPQNARVTIVSYHGDWIKVTYGGKTGFVYASYVTIDTPTSGTSDAEFEKQIANFPDSYKPYLRTMHKQYPKWRFKPLATGLKWNDVISKEWSSKMTGNPFEDKLNLVQRTTARAYRKYDYQDSIDSGGWVTASKSAVEYYMDPRNFLNTGSVFQFFSLKYDTSVQTDAGLKEIIGTSFLSKPIPANPSGAAETYTSYTKLLNDAGKKYLVNPMALASMIIIEQGYNGQTQSVSGNVPGYQGYYNFFHVGAYQENGITAQINGLKYAKRVGWNSRTKSILGGAENLGKYYVQSKQFTFYLQKFNVMNGLKNVGLHQYMGAVMGANLEGINFKNGIKTLNTNLVFEIPIYINMPAKPCPEPGKSSSSSGYDTSTVSAKIDRTAGKDRFATAEAVANKFKTAMGVTKVNNVVLASGTSYPDALSATYLAALKKAPILLVNNTNVYYLANYIKNNMRAGGTVYIVGGTSAVPRSMDSALAGLKYKRVYGKDRYETNLAVLKECGVKSGKIMVCSGQNFPDALSAAALAKPILLVNKTLTQKQESYIKNVSSGKYYIIGGVNAVSPSVEAKLKDYGKVMRVYGKDRFETSYQVANTFLKGRKNVVLVSGTNYPDGLAAAPLAVKLKAPILLVSKTQYNSAKKYTSVAKPTKIYVVGGTSVVPDNVASLVA